MKSKFKYDPDELERVRNHPKAVKVTDPNDPIWETFDFEALRDAVKAQNFNSWVEISKYSNDELRVLLAQSGTIYKLPEEHVPKNC